MADDRSLLERLNALKPSSVTLDPSNNALNVPATGIQPAEPLSREDALSKRLQTLRNRREEAEESAADPPPPPPPPYTEAAYTEAARDGSLHQQPAQPPSAPSPSQSANPTRAGHGGTANLQPDEEEDRTLDEILDSLDVEDDQWSVSEVDDDAGDSRRVEELLARLKDDPEAQPPKSPDGAVGGPARKHDDSDDSEADEMSRQVGHVISRAMDELKLEGPASPAGQGPDEAPVAPAGKTAPDGRRRAGGGSGDELPGDEPEDGHVGPTAALPRTPGDSDDDADDDGEPGLALPTVPTKLVDPAPAPAPTGDDPFESSIASRLAALKGAPIVQTDPFGLPSVPTFQPEDRPVPGVAKKPGYTDEDQKTWCIVCLEDGTVRCLGCDGDAYCARCWRDMHVGPSAGYDERGHQWEKLDRRRM